MDLNVKKRLKGLSLQVFLYLCIENQNCRIEMNKYIFFFAAMIMATTANAQNVWEKPKTAETQNEELTLSQERAAQKAERKAEKDAKAKAEEKYLSGAVTEQNDKVVWAADFNFSGKSAQELYDATLNALTAMMGDEKMLDGSAVTLLNKNEKIIVAAGKQWITFRNSFLSLDRAKFNYTLIAKCSDGAVEVEMKRIFFMYDENNGKGEYKLTAEEAINDKNALNKKKTKRVPGWAKFRRNAVDSKEEIFKLLKESIEKNLNK